MCCFYQFKESQLTLYDVARRDIPPDPPVFLGRKYFYRAVGNIVANCQQFYVALPYLRWVLTGWGTGEFSFKISVSHFNEDLSNDTIFVHIHLDG